jgi:hypothetical protein
LSGSAYCRPATGDAAPDYQNIGINFLFLSKADWIRPTRWLAFFF